jgi:hypothetical protein
MPPLSLDSKKIKKIVIILKSSKNGPMLKNIYSKADIQLTNKHTVSIADMKINYKPLCVYGQVQA